MEYFYNLLFYFAIYSFAGWCGEVVFATVRHGKFVNRGMLHGAYCPIYGFGLITVIVCLTPIKDSWLLLFAGSAVLTTVLEFITGFVLDKLFGRRWWDYSDKKFNIGGYICPQFTVVWGLACLLIMKVVQPAIAFAVGLIWNVKSNMVYTLCKHMVYMLSITNEHKNELEMRAKPEWKVHFLCFASAKRGSFSIR